MKVSLCPKQANSEFERGRIAELHKQGLSQCAIAPEIHRSKPVICNFLKDPEGYGIAKSSGRPKKISPALSRRIIRVVSQTEDDLPGKLRHSQMLIAVQ